jgi:hypothetical protein
MPSLGVSTITVESTVQTASRRGEDFDAIDETKAQSDSPDELSVPFTALVAVDQVVGPPEVPSVEVPEVTMLLADESKASASEQIHEAPAIPLDASRGLASKLAPADRKLLIQKGDEMLARGDVAGARLVYERAAESGDARAADGMARTFDPKVLKMIRVFGLRPDPDKAAFWYARSRALETLASTQ